MNFNKIKFSINTARRNVESAIKNVIDKYTLIQESGNIENFSNKETVEQFGEYIKNNASDSNEKRIIDDGTIKQVINHIIEKYTVPSIKLTPVGFGVANPLSTFFYGYPRYIDGDIPTDSSGKQLRFMAQVNCKDLDGLPDFPTKGLLQFWVQGDEYRMFMDIKDPKAYQVVYIENTDNNNIDNVELDESLYTTDSADFPYIWKNDKTPDMNYMMTSSKELIRPNTSDIEVLLNLFINEYNRISGISIDNKSIPKSVINTLKDDDRLKPSWGNRIGGYPSFTQNPPSGRTDSWETLLLQLDSDKTVNWGDSGIAGFYISHKDLINRDFRNINFYWDCY